LKERWEDLKKNILINPQGNRVRFVPIVPNNVSRNTLPSNLPRNLLFKPFIPKHMINNNPSKDNIDITQFKNEKENKNTSPINHMETPLYPTRFNMNSHKSVSLQISQKQQEIQLNTSASFVEKCNMNSLENSLPKLPLRTIWTNDNTSRDFKCTLPLKNNSLKKPFSPSLNCMSQTMENTNYVLKSKFQNKSQVLPSPLNTINNSKFLKSYSVSTTQSQKLYPIAENTNTSFFTSDIEKSSVACQNISSLESNTLKYINQPFNTDNIWKDYPYQSPKM